MHSDPVPHPRFSDHIRAFLRRNTPVVRTIALPVRRHVYTTGDEDRMLYVVESGGVKLVIGSGRGRDCLIDVMIAGELFGESCLTGVFERIETATAVSRTVLKAVSLDDLLPFLRHHSLYEPFIAHLALRIADLEGMAADLCTLPSDQRLAKTFLRLALKCDLTSATQIRLPYRLSQEELADCVGTTRPRISAFMNRFRNAGLIDWSPDRHVIVFVDRVSQYLDE